MPPALLISSTASWMLSASGRPSDAPGPLSETTAPITYGSLAADAPRGGAAETVRARPSASAPTATSVERIGEDLLGAVSSAVRGFLSAWVRVHPCDSR